MALAHRLGRDRALVIPMEISRLVLWGYLVWTSCGPAARSCRKVVRRGHGLRFNGTTITAATMQLNRSEFAIRERIREF